MASNQRLQMVYSDPHGEALSPEQIEQIAWESETLAVPDASGSDYIDFFLMCGAEKVKVLDNTSSAADWTFAVKKDALWYIAFQYNNWPNSGFSYCIDAVHSHPSFESILNTIQW